MPRNPIRADERDFIHECLSVDRAVSFSDIARELERHRSTISREVARNGGRHAYRPSTAGHAAATRQRRPKILVLAVEGPLRDLVIELVSKGYSPVATAALCARQGDGTVCAETIYQGIYDGTLGLKVTDCLRSRRPRRKKRRATTSSRASALGPNAVPISERPAEAAEGASGHWEGDLVRHEAPLNLAVMKGHHHMLVAAGVVKLRAA